MTCGRDAGALRLLQMVDAVDSEGLTLRADGEEEADVDQRVEVHRPAEERSTLSVSEHTHTHTYTHTHAIYPAFTSVSVLTHTHTHIHTHTRARTHIRIQARKKITSKNLDVAVIRTILLLFKLSCCSLICIIAIVPHDISDTFLKYCIIHTLQEESEPKLKFVKK